jgi:glycine/D-amino acid oxidase-like deaminating enzyme
VVIIGAGYTGLAAARALARAGTRVVVLERETVGFGASRRNGGMVLPGYKQELPVLVRRFGLPMAQQLFRDSREAVAFTGWLITEEGIACDWRRSGHVTLAAKPSHLHGLEECRRLLERDFGYTTSLLGPTEVGQEVGSRRYHGGLVDPEAAAVQPAALVQGLHAAAERAGATVHEGVEVAGIRAGGAGVEISHRTGRLTAGQVLIATNGYTGRLLPWLARRIVPVGSFIVATERLAPDVQRRIIPGNRMLSDTRNLLYYFRLSPDGRLVFGGRAAFLPTALERSRAMLEAGIAEVYPDLAGIPIEFAWGGTLGFTLDQLPHAGSRGPVAYALGYGGHGVAMATWLGHQVALAMAGQAPWPALAQVPFRAIPLYEGRPWFLPLAGAYYGFKDWLL